MKTSSWIAASLAGFVLGAILVIACSDDSPDDADAAVCDCPSAEPPLAGRITSVRNQTTISGASTGIAGAGCPIGATILGGGCEQMAVDAGVVLLEARIDRTTNQPTYVCTYSSTVAGNHVVFAEAICLMPAQ